MNNENNNKISWYKRPVARFQSIITRYPFATFLTALVALVLFMAIGNAINKPKVEKKDAEKVVKEVSTYAIGSAPKIQVQASVKKTGTVTIYAQTAGIVQKVYKKEGDTVAKGTNLVWISSNYAGGTISTIQRQQAELNYKYNQDNLPTQLDTIAKQKTVANESRENTEQLRQITDKSVQETQDLLDLNNQQYNNIVTTIRQLEQNNADGSQTTTINQLKAQQSQLSAGINQLMQAQRNAQYQRDTEKPPTKLADLQRDLTLQQLGLQEKAVQLQLDISRFTMQTAQISESLNYPASPFAGTVERINVIPGQTVNPGEVIAVITANTNSATAEAVLSASIAQKINKTEPSILYISGTPVEIFPMYVSSQPTTGQMYTIKYQIPESSSANVTNNSFLQLEIPVGTAETTNAIPFIPIDSIFQTQDGAYVYVAQKKDQNYEAKSKKITIGELSGKFVEVKDGLSANDIIITDRNVLEGDLVKIK